jgi:predicted glycosyltransferase
MPELTDTRPHDIAPRRRQARPMNRFEKTRILMYSHDTFGLGHLRRCRTIAHALVESFRGLSVLIVSGSQIAGAFDYRARVDFVKIPSVIKLRNGEYTALAAHMDIKETIAMRRSIIRHTAEMFRPDIFIVDKEPMGLRGEAEETLAALKAAGTTLVLGLREVMDAPHLLAAEWDPQDMLARIDRYYDQIWVYGPPEFHDPLAGLEVPAAVRARMSFVGFLQRRAPPGPLPGRNGRGDYLLVTTGGGGDGADLVRDVLAAYRHDPDLPQRALVVLGPYMPADRRAAFQREAQGLDRVEVIEFDARMETLIAGSRAVVAMGGYNTYCEILSFDKPALIVPRTAPREEQLLRAQRAAQLGLVDMLLPAEAADPARMAAALRALPGRRRPSEGHAALRLEGLPTIARLVAAELTSRAERGAAGPRAAVPAQQ